MTKGLLMLGLSAVLALQGTFAFAQVGDKPAGDPRVERLLDAADLNYEVDDDDDFRLLIEFNDGRSQLVWVLSNTTELDALDIRELWSIAYRSDSPLPARVARRLLSQNANVKIGAWQTRKMGDEYVALFSAQIAADTDPATLVSVVQAVSATADEMEIELTGGTDEL